MAMRHGTGRKLMYEKRHTNPLTEPLKTHWFTEQWLMVPCGTGNSFGLSGGWLSAAAAVRHAGDMTSPPFRTPK